MKWILVNYEEGNDLKYIIKSPSPPDENTDTYGVYNLNRDKGPLHSVVNVVEDQINGEMKDNLRNILRLRKEFDVQVI